MSRTLSSALYESKAAQLLSIGWHFAQARWRWSHLPDLAAFQDARMRQITAYAQQHSAFYRQHWQGYQLASWQPLPTIDKRMMMEHFTTFNTCGIEREQAMQVALTAEQQRDFAPTLGGMTVGLSSGTSGHRGLFLVSPAEQRAWAGTILARTLHRLRWQPATVAFFLRSNSNLYEQVGGRLVRFHYVDLMVPLEQAIPRLNRLQPDLLVGPPSLLELLGRELGSSLRIAPERLVAVAEVLEPQDQQRLQQWFGVPVHQIYQCTEGFIAASCVQGSLHLQEDVVAVQCEPLPGDVRRVVPIISDLWRTTQPIVRYRLNDVLKLRDQPCGCGSPFRVIEAVEGRCDDLFAFPDSTGNPRLIFPDLIRRMLLLSSAEIEEYQAIQDRCGHMELRLMLRDPSAWSDVVAAVRRAVQTTLSSYGCSANQLDILPGLVPLAAGAKRRRVWRRQQL